MASKMLVWCATAGLVTTSVLVGFNGSGSAGLVSRSGSLIAFTRVFAHPVRFRIFLARVDGRNVRWLRTGVSVSYEPRWSPNGHWILFRGGAGDDLYLIQPDGTALRQLTHDRALDQSGAWSPNGAEIAFQRERTRSGPSSIWVLRLKSGAMRRLTPDALGAESPSWSADSSKIVFVSQTARHGWTPELWLMDADGSHAHHIFPSLDGASEPVWAPRGNRLLISDQTKLYVVDSRRGHPRALVALGMNSSGEREAPFAQWSPDGTRIVFNQLGRQGRSAIWIVNDDGSGLRRLTMPPQGVLLDNYPSWQP